MKLKLQIFQEYFTPHSTPETRQEQNLPGSQTHLLYTHAEQFPAVRVFNRKDT